MPLHFPAVRLGEGEWHTKQRKENIMAEVTVHWDGRTVPVGYWMYPGQISPNRGLLGMALGSLVLSFHGLPPEQAEAIGRAIIAAARCPGDSSILSPSQPIANSPQAVLGSE